MGEPRWVRQKDEYNCGPIAVANALKWAGLPCSWKRDRGKLIKMCDSQVGIGSTPDSVINTLRATSGKTLAVDWKTKWTIQELHDHVESRGAVIVVYTPNWRVERAKSPDDREGHFALLVDVMGDGQGAYYKLINACKWETIRWVSRREFRKMFRCGRKGDSMIFLSST